MRRTKPWYRSRSLLNTKEHISGRSWPVRESYSFCRQETRYLTNHSTFFLWSFRFGITKVWRIKRFYSKEMALVKQALIHRESSLLDEIGTILSTFKNQSYCRVCRISLSYLNKYWVAIKPRRLPYSKMVKHAVVQNQFPSCFTSFRLF